MSNMPNQQDTMTITLGLSLSSYRMIGSHPAPTRVGQSFLHSCKIERKSIISIQKMCSNHPDQIDAGLIYDGLDSAQWSDKVVRQWTN